MHFQQGVAGNCMIRIFKIHLSQPFNAHIPNLMISAKSAIFFCMRGTSFPEYHLVLSYSSPTQPPSRRRRILRAGCALLIQSACNAVISLVGWRRNVFRVSTVCPQALVSWVALLDCVCTKWVGIEVSVCFSRLEAAVKLQQRWVCST
jgi:hypothetical protein